MSFPRNVVSLTSHFCLGQSRGMKHYEVLSRSSASLVSFNNRSFVLSCLHVVYPFLYPNYYQQDWLQNIERKHVSCSLDLRSMDNGEVESTFLLKPDNVIEHPYRDIVAFQLEFPKQLTNLVAVHGLGRTLAAPMVGSSITFCGHSVIPTVEDGQDVSPMIPETIAGKISDRQEVVQSSREGKESVHQLFGFADEVLEMGMCGGPVLTRDKECVGIIEGIVSTPGHALENHVAIIERDQICSWLDSSV